MSLTLRILGLAAVVATACGVTTGEVRDAFSESYSCPEERITVTPRPDLSAYQLDFGDAKPLADVAADPQRLALWQSQREKLAHDLDSVDSVYATSGCGVTTLLICTPRHRVGAASCHAPLAPSAPSR